jgi:hypothetical protein
MKKQSLIIITILFFSFGAVNAQITNFTISVGGGETIVVSCKDTTNFNIIIDDIIILEIETTYQKISFSGSGLLFREKDQNYYKESSIVLNDGGVVEILLSITKNIFYLELFYNRDSWIIINPTIEDLEKL